MKYKLDPEKLYDQLEKQKYKCFYTGVVLIPGENAGLDHLKPGSKNPDLTNDLNNVVWCDKRINNMKGNFSYEEFIEICKKILDFGESGRLGNNNLLQSCSL